MPNFTLVQGEIRRGRRLQRRKQLDEVGRAGGDVVGLGESVGRERAGGDGDDAQAVGAGAGDVARGVADDDGALARPVARARAGERRQLLARLGVGAEAALARLEERRRSRPARA